MRRSILGSCNPCRTPITRLLATLLIGQLFARPGVTASGQIERLAGIRSALHSNIDAELSRPSPRPWGVPMLVDMTDADFKTVADGTPLPATASPPKPIERAAAPISSNSSASPSFAQRRGTRSAGVKKLTPYQLASKLLDRVPPGKLIALRPLFAHESGLSPDVAARLYDELFSLLFEVSDLRHTLLSRRRLEQIYGSLEEFQQGDINSLLKKARAEIEIICTPNLVTTGIELFCSAVELSTVRSLGIGKAVFQSGASEAAVPIDAALIDVARQLVAALPQTSPVGAAVITDDAIRGQSELARFVQRRLLAHISKFVDRRFESEGDQRVTQSALSGRADTPEAKGPRYTLEGSLSDLDDDRITIDTQIRNRNKVITRTFRDIAVASIPARLRDRRSLGGHYHDAISVAVVSEGLDAKAALRGAKNLARARLVAQALALPAPPVDEIRTEADAASVLKYALGKGLPVDESFEHESMPDSGNRIVVRLRARVTPVGTKGGPALSARLSKSEYKANEPIQIELESPTRTYVGIYAWGADNMVVRLYPNEATSLVVIEPGKSRLLPRPYEAQIASMPMPIEGNMEDHEAIIVVASPMPIKFASLAGAAGKSLAQTMSIALPGTKFFSALAANDPSRLTIRVLPYRVHQ